FFKQVNIGHVFEASEKETQENNERIGNLVFIPVLTLAVVAVGVAQLTPLGGQVGIGIGSVVSLLVAMAITKASPTTALKDGDRMVQQVGTTGILPQLLAALGVIFTEAGVGDVISGAISSVIPEGNRLAGVVAYCLGM